jgi:hypothetical protein
MKDINKLKIVWVEVGRPLPKYAIRNFQLIHRMHQDVEQTLVSDRSTKLHFLEVYNKSEIPRSSKSEEFAQIEKKWPFKQEYFWLGTTKRFFYLYDLMLHLELKNVVHLETDCILLETIPIRSFFESRNKNLMAYPLQASEIGCASILLIKSHQILGEFLDLVIADWNKNGEDDMSLLGKFSKNERVTCLPTWSNKESDTFMYDAQSIGKYFLGTDARNCRFPFAQRGKVDLRSGSIFNDLENTEYSWKILYLRPRIRVVLKSDGATATLVNIHVHSKHILLSIQLMLFLIRFGFKRRNSLIWKLGLFDWRVFLERAVSWFNRRILRRNPFEEKIFR